MCVNYFVVFDWLCIFVSFFVLPIRLTFTRVRTCFTCACAMP